MCVHKHFQVCFFFSFLIFLFNDTRGILSLSSLNLFLNLQFASFFISLCLFIYIYTISKSVRALEDFTVYICCFIIDLPSLLTSLRLFLNFICENSGPLKAADVVLNNFKKEYIQGYVYFATF